MVNSSSGENLDHEADVYEQIFNSLDALTQIELRANILTFLPEARKDLEWNRMDKFYDQLVAKIIIPDKCKDDLK